MRRVLISLVGVVGLTAVAHARDFGGGVGPHALTDDGTSTYKYDSNGNVVEAFQGGTITALYLYNNTRQVKKVVRGTQVQKTLYDADGNKLVTMAISGSNYAEVYTQLDSARVLHRPQAVPKMLYRYGEAELDSQVRPSFDVVDHLGSTVAVVNASGVEQLRDHQAFGGEWYSLAPTATPIDRDFNGKELRGGTLDYAARQMVPGSGVFLQADTFIPDPSRLIGFNRYTYVGNNPVSRIDPTGHAQANAADALAVDPFYKIRPPSPSERWISDRAAWLGEKLEGPINVLNDIGMATMGMPAVGMSFESAAWLLGRAGVMLRGSSMAYLEATNALSKRAFSATGSLAAQDNVRRVLLMGRTTSVTAEEMAQLEAFAKHVTQTYEGVEGVTIFGSRVRGAGMPRGLSDIDIGYLVRNPEARLEMFMRGDELKILADKMVPSAGKLGHGVDHPMIFWTFEEYLERAANYSHMQVVTPK